jgi:hypothetical protein
MSLLSLLEGLLGAKKVEVNKATQYKKKYDPKGQGKTIDNIFVDLGNRAFASGQTYVALSRCPTLDGIRLERPITSKDIYIDEEIRNFYINSF